MQHEGINIAPQLRHQKRHPVRYETGHERHVARQPVELGDHDVSAGPLRRVQGRRQDRAPLQGIGALAGFDFGQLVEQGDLLALAELPGGGLLGRQSEA